MPKKKTVKKKTVKSNNTNNKAAVVKETKKKNSGAHREVIPIITFALALFLLAVVLIPGGSIWGGMHNILFGLFGVCTYALPIFIGVVSVLYAMDKLTGNIKGKIGESCLLVMLIGASVDIFTADETLGFVNHVEQAYIDGIELKSGGFFGALIGHPLTFAFERTGAIITICLLIFVLLLILTGTTLINFFKALIKPVKKIEEVAESAYENADGLDEEEKQPVLNKKREKVNLPASLSKDKNKIDFALSDEEQEENDNRSLRDKKNKLIDCYTGVETVDEQPSVIDESIKQEVKNSINSINESKPEDKSVDIKDDSVLFEPPTQEVAEPEQEEIPEPVNVYRYPPVSLLKATKSDDIKSISNELETTGKRLVEVLESFGVETKIINISRGPAVTRYELKPSAGVKISKITNLADDIALNLASSGVRIEAPIPNKPAVGIEVPNKNTNVVGVREIINSPQFEDAKSKLTVALGRDIAGEITVTDISKMPHGLIAGATGSGKSVCINSIIISLLYKASPDDVKLLLIDPKVVELGIYNGIPHLLVPVVTDPRKAAGSLGWAVLEMERRYKLFAENDVRNIDGYNGLVEHREDLAKMPHIVIIIDELADLMMTAPGDVEDAICRIAQKARAAGMHLIVATQRPSVDVVTGLIKANIPTRIAFAVSSQIDSRTILDVGGAEKLMGRGDMLFCPTGAPKPLRIQGCFVSDAEVENVVSFIKNAQKAQYNDEISMEIDRLATVDKNAKNSKNEEVENGDDADPMLDQAIEVVVEAGQASTSLLQRRLKLGYSRAARIIDQMEARGVVDGYQGSKPRNVLITKDQLFEMKMRKADNEEF